MNFTYNITLAPNEAYGSLRPDGSWTGMVGLLANREADLGAYMSATFPSIKNTNSIF